MATKKVVKKVAVKKAVKKVAVKKAEPKIGDAVKKEIKKEAGGKCIVCEGINFKKTGGNEYTCNDCGASWTNDATVGDFNKEKVNQFVKNIKRVKKVEKKSAPKAEPKVADKPRKVKKEGTKKKVERTGDRFRVTGTVNEKEIETDSPRKFVFPVAEKAGIKYEDVWTASAVKLIVSGSCKIRGKEIKMSLKNPNLKIRKGDKILYEVK